MKKLLSVLASLAMLTTMSPVYSECTISDNTDLKSLAASLGADTDYLNILNYEHGPDYPDLQNVYLKFLSNCNQLEATRYPQSFYYTAVMSGSDMGISLLEILAHNGVISPSDIQNGAQSLSEITLNDETDKVITAYQVTQFHTEFSNYMEYLIASQTYEQQIDSLISTAESCMENNRYFLVTIKGQDMNHSVCGIGISEGEWEWNGKKYDKCILTLDSNDTDKDEKADGFREESCIYINAETKESYIPAYNLDMTDEPALPLTMTSQELEEKLSTKRYTDAKLRRALLFAMTEVTRELLGELPEYTTLLAANSKGRELLAANRKSGGITVVTKPADMPADSAQALAARRLDAIFTLAKMQPNSSGEYMKRGAYIE